MLKWIDIPPVWFAGFLVAGSHIKTYASFGLVLDNSGIDLLAGMLVGAGVILIGLAVMAMRQRKTTIIPHKNPDALVTDGIFKRTRNPIYLGDTLILAGLFVLWGAMLSLALVPIFLWAIEKRFVLPEEDRLRRQFKADFARYAQKTRRWV